MSNCCAITGVISGTAWWYAVSGMSWQALSDVHKGLNVAQFRFQPLLGSTGYRGARYQRLNTKFESFNLPFSLSGSGCFWPTPAEHLSERRARLGGRPLPSLSFSVAERNMSDGCFLDLQKPGPLALKCGRPTWGIWGSRMKSPAVAAQDRRRSETSKGPAVCDTRPRVRSIYLNGRDSMCQSTSEIAHPRDGTARISHARRRYMVAIVRRQSNNHVLLWTR
jgi:hypothetical protein